MLAVALLGVASLPGPIQAQEPEQREFASANPREDYRHGRILKIETIGGEKLEGTVVRVDRKTNQMFLRTSPGAAPTAVVLKDIKTANVAVKQETRMVPDEKNPTRLVSTTVKTSVETPEIQQIVIYNGNKKSVSYIGASLSPGERSRLSELETTENEMSRLDVLSKVQDQVLVNDLAIQEGQRRHQELMNDLLWKQVPPGGYATSLMQTPYTEFTSLIPFMPYTYGYTGPIRTKFIESNYPSTPVPFVRVGATVFPNLPVAPDALTKARQSYVTAQSRAIFENGQLVAVIDN